jgi:hypothetical protein
MARHLGLGNGNLERQSPTRRLRTNHRSSGGHYEIIIQQDITDPDSIPIRISTDDLRHGIKSWKETTSTSPSGRHLGYYHSILAYEPPPVDADTPRDSDRILGVIANLIDSALQTGFVFTRWCKIVNAMIEKSPDDHSSTS